MIKALSTLQLSSGSPDQKRRELKDYFLDSFDTYEALFGVLNHSDAFYQRPEKLRHPLIFYFGHTATFYVNKLMFAKTISTRINPKFEALFAVGVDEMSWDDLNDRNYDWPTVDAVRRYRNNVRDLVLSLIDTLPVTLPVTWDSILWPIIMGIEHERIHLETSSVLIRQLDLQWVTPSSRWPICQTSGPTPNNPFIKVPEGMVSRNKTLDDQYYGWDNEYGTHKAGVKEFEVSQQLVSNGEFLAFVAEGGYKTERFWEDEGNQWRKYTEAEHPTFWRKSDNGYVYRAMLEEIQLPLDWPVDVNYHEAKAYCNYMSEKLGESVRLPTEDEWTRVIDCSGFKGNLFDEGLNIGLGKYASSEPVTINKQGEFFDIAGNVWQWTETPIYPFDGFKVHPLYDDFTTPTYDNKHNLIKGGSWISTGNEASKDSRYAFRRHFYQHAGFRMVKSNTKITVSDFDYESDTQVSQYCAFHYGFNRLGVANFAKASAEYCIEQNHGRSFTRALDLGCAVGRTSFELAKAFDHVDGIDFSARFIKTAISMQERGEVRYNTITEGELTQFNVNKAYDLELSDVLNKVSFHQGDAGNLKPQFDNYDLIFMGNLVDRLANPAEVIREVIKRVNLGGLLIVASPFTWLEEYTPRENWLGGYKDATGETLTSTQALIEVLANLAVPIGESCEIPFVITETSRKHQYTFSEFNAFQRIA